MKKCNSNGTAKPQAVKTSQNTKPYRDSSTSSIVIGLATVVGYFGDNWCKAVGFFRGRLVVFEQNFSEITTRPVTLREAAKECDALIKIGKTACLDFIDESELAQAKFYRMLAKVIR